VFLSLFPHSFFSFFLSSLLPALLFFPSSFFCLCLKLPLSWITVNVFCC
jgi:hypothetical protein